MAAQKIHSIHILSDDFQWITPNHIAAVERAGEGADVVLFLVSDADVRRSIVAPFSFEERCHMIEAAFPGLLADGRLRVMYVPSQPYSKSASYALQAIEEALDQLLGPQARTDIKVSIQGYQMDRAAAVRPEWTLVPDDIKDVSEQLFQIDAYLRSSDFVAGSSRLSEFLTSFRESEHFAALQRECEDKHSVQMTYGQGPFHTADAICTYGNKVLLITRKNHPYQGALATPGGLIDPDEDPLNAAIRELLEETEMRVPANLLSGDELEDGDEWAIVTAEFLRSRAKNKKPYQFAGATRDPRGDYRANAFWFDLSDLPVIPRVLGGDDAARADWVTKDTLTTPSMAFDHFAILCDLQVLSYPATIQEARRKAAQ